MKENFFLFLSSYDLWGNAVIAGVIIGSICGFLGIYVILHRIVFVSAAMSQVSSLGVMIAFFLAQIEVLSARHPYEDIFPLLLAAAMTGVFAVILAGQAQARIANRSKSAESLIGAAYLISTAGLILVGDRVTQGAHDVANILFGNAVAIDGAHMIFLFVLCIPLFFLHLWYRKDLLFISFDPTMAATLKYPVVLLRVFLLVSLGIIISIGTRTIGALPVFSFSVLPAMAALILFENLSGSFLAAAIFGGLSAFLGYFFSFVFSFPTGACMTITAALILVFSKFISVLRKT
jgi:zinc transport system permease protein